VSVQVADLGVENLDAFVDLQRDAARRAASLRPRAMRRFR
jgi:hypothetical protein